MMPPWMSGATTGVKVFTATMIERRARLGDDITSWLRAHPDCLPVRAEVRLSSDAKFHCLSIVIFWRSSSGDA